MQIERRVALVILTALTALAVAIPVLAASPAPSAAPSSKAGPEGSERPDRSGKPEKPGKPAKADQGPEVAITLTGTVVQGKDGQGRPTFTMTAQGKTWTLADGPPWFWGDKNPLAAYAGKTVTVAGTQEAGGTEIDVETVDGKALRAPGKPPWAGGPWVVGPKHPGWKPWMADGKPGKGQGREQAPGQLKKASPAP
jgi:hypothetical protein